MTYLASEVLHVQTESTRSSSAHRLAMVLGLVHACVDATTVTVVFRAANLHELTASHAFALVLGYDLIAFGSQVVLGLGADRWRLQGTATRVGLLLTVLSVAVLYWQPVLAMLCAGFGNALFHMGAGALVLRRGLAQSAPAGIFVAPGALGLAFGMTYGKLPDLGPVWPLAAATVLGLFVSWSCTQSAPLDGATRVEPDSSLKAVPSSAARLVWLVLGLLLVSVAVRSLVGFAATRGAPASVWLFFGVPTAAFLGKALGGLIADRLGWIETTVIALVASAPCIVLGYRQPLVLLIGLCLFQMTMPVTLAAVARLMPDRLSTAFGWTCLALILGALPTLFTASRALCTRPMLAVWIVLACISVTLGLRLLGVELKLQRSWQRT